ncbi:MAG: hypothetical protein E7179_05035 [Erysipelotrichaceae bacterium]|jgi:hypothetical protein|nr:hypothetical protein [Erysipelotrichaceae bacterium]
MALSTPTADGETPTGCPAILAFIRIGAFFFYMVAHKRNPSKDALPSILNFYSMVVFFRENKGFSKEGLFVPF